MLTTDWPDGYVVSNKAHGRVLAADLTDLKTLRPYDQGEPRSQNTSVVSLWRVMLCRCLSR